MKKRVSWLTISGLMVMSLILASCTSAPAAETTSAQTVKGKTTQSTSTTTTATTTTPATATASQDAGKEVAPAEEEIKTDGTLVFYTAVSKGGPGTWALRTKYGVFVRGYASLIYEGLLVGDWYRGPSGTNETPFNNWGYAAMYTGSLAESWSVPDPLTYIFHLREDAYFQNKAPCWGRQLVASDVVDHFNWHRVEKGRMQYVESVTAIDKYTVEIKTSEARPFWNHDFGAGSYTSIVPEEVVAAGGEDWMNACGTGPFMLDDYVAGSAATFIRNPNYRETWTSAEGTTYQLPLVETVIMPHISEFAVSLAALRAGKLDLHSRMQAPNIAGAIQTGPHLLWRKSNFDQQWNLVFNLEKERWQDERVRRALSMAIDRKAIRDTLGEGYGRSQPLYPLSPAHGAMYPKWPGEWPQEVVENWTYNPGMAEELLDKAGYPRGADGTRFNMKIIGRKHHVDAVSFVADYFSKIGVELDIEILETAVYWQRDEEGLFDLSAYTMTGSPGALVSVGTQATEMDLETGEFLNPLLNAAVASNWKGITDSVGDLDLQNEYSATLVKDFWTLAPYIGFSLGDYFQMWQPWVNNYSGEMSMGVHEYGGYLKFIWIDSDLRTEMGYR